jgi:type 1 glutamine amidotransferase
MSQPTGLKAHVIAGGYPPGSPAGHDSDYARLRILQMLYEHGAAASVANDFDDVEKWLPGRQLLVTYVSGPYPGPEQDRFIRGWLAEGGRWLGLHGTSGGKAVRVQTEEGRTRRRMVRLDHHETLGGFFLNHPPVRRFRVDVAAPEHPLVRGLPPSFEVADELYMVEVQDPASSTVLLTTEMPEDPSPPGFGFAYEEDTAFLPDGRTRALAFAREVGAGGVAYIALGHCHSPSSNSQPFVDASVEPSGTTPLEFRGPWETEPFERLMENAVAWGLGIEA